MSIPLILEAVRRHGPDLAAYKELGEIRVIRQDDLLLFNYKETAVYARTWNSAERVSRGLIIHWPSATPVAVPFQKFFNLGERPETQLEALPTGPFEVTAKLDGSLGILYRRADGYAIATRGSFTSEQAQWATAYARAHYDFSALPDNMTLLFEIIYPENRIVINYGETRALYLIGAISFDENGDTFDFDYATLCGLAQRRGCPVVESTTVESCADLVELARQRTGVEGWVIRFPNGLRVKVKTEEYVHLHRLISSLSPKRVQEAMLEGVYTSYVAALPDEFQCEADAYEMAIRQHVETEKERIMAIYRELKPLAAESRKPFALEVVQNHKADQPYLFSLLDERNITPMLIKNTDLTALFGDVEEVLEDA